MDELKEKALYLAERWIKGFKNDTMGELVLMPAWKAAFVSGHIVYHLHTGDHPKEHVEMFLNGIATRFGG